MTQYTEDEPAAKAEHFANDLAQLGAVIVMVRKSALSATEALLREG